MGDETVLERILNGEEDPKDLPLALLQSITNDFSQDRKIGQGGFGAVYKGVLRNGFIVAVKRIYINLHRIDVDDKLFRREFNSMWKTNHQNVVRCLGFCSNTSMKPIEKAGSKEIALANVRERLFCLEYIGNGSLDKHITDELRGLEWETRYEIITGICNGLCYLHDEKKIVHMDLKPANVLLHGKYMVPKITDFGLSRPDENSHTMAQPIGTVGYIAPEYVKDGKTSAKSDIYSLGAIICELVTGCMSIPDKNNVLRRWRHRWNKPPTLLQYQQVTRCIEIAARCRKQEPNDRPCIGHIINFLRKFESTDGHIGQESTYLDDDMLGIEPLNLKFDEEMSWSVKLTNKTKACFAFSIERPSRQYTIQPDKGIVTPGCCEHLVQIAVTAPEVIQNADKLIVRSTKVNEDLRVEDITKDIFYEAADEVDLMVVYEPVEAVSPKAINSSSYEDSMRGQLDRRNFHPPENFSQSQPANMTYLHRVSDRAIDVTRGAMGSLLHKLGKLLTEEFNLEVSVKKDVQSLSKELEEMQLVLHKMSEVQQDNLDDRVKRWASNVREMSYDLDDFMDGFLVYNEPDSNTSGFRELTHELCFLLEKGKSHHTISDLIKDRKKQVQDAVKECKGYKVDNVVPHTTARAAIDELRILAMYEDKEQLVGIETPRDVLIRLFEEDGDVSKQNLKIVSIVGLGGLGKTTLAKAVYDKLKAQYDLKTFVSVGQKPDVKKVLRNILRKVVKDFNVEKLDEEDLIEKLQESLEDKRYFIVIDDIWDSEAWGRITYAFPRNNNGSRVITTTRIERVARDCCKVESKYVYRMKPLSEEDSRRLFLGRIFGPGKDCPDAQEEISTDILKRCGGMPLAINSIASLLAGEPDSTWDYARKTLGAMTEGNDHGNMKQILDLSYIHLPDHLKTCLLYVCIYPEDREIDKNDLLRKWVAEGFVHVSRTSGLDAEDVAEKYFKELINMCMIQPGKIDYNNEVLSCRVHDIILDLVRSKSSKENFIDVIDGSKDKTGGIRRALIDYNDKVDMRILENKGSLSHVRSVLYRGSLVRCSLEFKFLRVLHIEHECFSANLDLTGISRLFLLRCLKISCSRMFQLKLPNQIGELQQLETVDLDGVYLKKYPSDIVSLPWLSHLRFGGSGGIALPDGIDRLKSLRTLEGVSLHRSSVDNIMGLGKLTNLRKLQICFWEDVHANESFNMGMNALHSSIPKLSASLRILTLGDEWGDQVDAPDGWSSSSLFPRGSNIRELDLECCMFERFPRWISQLRKLHKFSIVVEEVADGVSILGGLPSLAYLQLKTRQKKEKSVVIPGGGAFQALKELNFHCSTALLTFEAAAMPKLEKLEILFRHQMTAQFLPVGIQHLPAPTLKNICLRVGGCLYNSEEWDDNGWCIDYSAKLLFTEDLRQHYITVSALLKGAFKPHHPGADIRILVPPTGRRRAPSCFPGSVSTAAPPP